MKQFIVQLLIASVASQTVGGVMGIMQGGLSYSEFSSGDGSFYNGGEGMSANMASDHMAAGHASSDSASMETTTVTTGGGHRKLQSTSAQSSCGGKLGYEMYTKPNGKRSCRKVVTDVDEFDLEDEITTITSKNARARPGRMARARCGNVFQYRSVDGRCLDCPEGMMGSEDARNCVPSTVAKAGISGSCGPEQIYSVHGHYCIQCPKNMRSSPDGSHCIAYEMHAIYEFSSHCGTNQIPQPGGGCIDYSCNRRQRVLPDGECQYCDAFSARMETNPFYCAPQFCSTRQKLLPSGQCEQCPPFTLTRGFYCSEQECHLNEYLTADGECNQCPPRHIHTPDQRGCQFVTCKGNSFVTFEGYCIPCPAYTTVSGNGMTCTMPMCSSGQIFTKEGKCEHCPDFTRPVGNGYVCERSECAVDETLQINGLCVSSACPFHHIRDPGTNSCKECNLYSHPNADQTECIYETCSKYQYLRVDGTCSYCGAFMRPGSQTVVIKNEDVDGNLVEITVATMCERPICGQNSILKVNGDCEACTDGQKAVAGGYYCVEEYDHHDDIDPHGSGHRLLEQAQQEKIDVFMG